MSGVEGEELGVREEHGDVHVDEHDDDDDDEDSFEDVEDLEGGLEHEDDCDSVSESGENLLDWEA